MRYERLITFLALILFLLPRADIIALGGDLITILEPQVFHTFGERIEFTARLESNQPVEKVEVIYSPLDGSGSFVGLANLENGRISYLHNFKMVSGSISVFSPVEYRFKVTLQDGQTALSDFYTFVYTDNRFDWQVLEDHPLRIYWIEGDLAFGQAVLDAAQAGLAHVRMIMDFPELGALDIYVYARDSDFQSAINLSAFPLVAGKTLPEIGVVMVSLPPGPTQRLDIQNKIPHEMMHVMIHEKYGSRSVNIPTWLNEGLASLAQSDQNLFHEELQSAIDGNSLLRMESICSGFSKQQYEFYLSYAQSESFTRFLYENYGRNQMVELLDRYADGVECSRAPQLVYGQSLARLEDNWYRELVGGSNWLSSLQPLIPWMVLLAAVLFVPLILALGVLRREPQTPVSQSPAKGQ